MLKNFFTDHRFVSQLFLYVVLSLINSAMFAANTIYFHGLGISDEQFCCSEGCWNRDNMLSPFRELKRVLAIFDYELNMARDDGSNIEDPKYVIAFNIFPSFLNLIKKYSKEKLIAFLWEPPIKEYCLNYNLEVHKAFAKIFTWDDDLVDDKTYFKIYYPQPSLNMIDEIVDFNQKKFCTLINAHQFSSHPLELCSERLNVINFFEHNLQLGFEFYGAKWDSSSFKNYRGRAQKKLDVLREYKFCFCYENTKARGYVTEKILDCFVAGCVPVYLGAQNIEKYIPKSCYIKRSDFENMDQLVAHLQSIDLQKYNEYIENIRKFLKSSQARFFSQDHFIETFLNKILLKKLPEGKG